MSVCKHCGKPLNQSQYDDSHTLKSCPSCSSNDGMEHIFYRYPAEFGTSDKRISIATPDGAQSYCIRCRSDKNGGPYQNAVKCSQL